MQLLSGSIITEGPYAECLHVNIIFTTYYHSGGIVRAVLCANARAAMLVLQLHVKKVFYIGPDPIIYLLIIRLRVLSNRY